MAYLLLQLFFTFVFFLNKIDTIVINCTASLKIYERIPDRIIGMIAIANSSNEEIFWDKVIFKQGDQFPLNFIVVIDKRNILTGRYTLQLHIYQIPRGKYDDPLWIGELPEYLIQKEKPNSAEFIVYRENAPRYPCLIGIVYTTDVALSSRFYNQLNVVVGSMPTTIISYESYLYSPFIFLITNISSSEMKNSTSVYVSLKSEKTIQLLEMRKLVDLSIDTDCATAIFRLSTQKTMNITLTLSAHVLTDISLIPLSVTYRIYQSYGLVYENTQLLDVFEFPYIISEDFLPIAETGVYSIEATIFGPLTGLSNGVTFFQGVKSARLRGNVRNNISISMLYIGPEIGTTIIGVLTLASPSINTWPLLKSNLALTISDENSKKDGSYQFIIYDQTFPIQFTILNVKEIDGNRQNVAFVVTITYIDGTVIWGGAIEKTTILYNKLNQFNMELVAATNSSCQKPGSGYCDSSNTSLNNTCCSHYKCNYGECKPPPK